MKPVLLAAERSGMDLTSPLFDTMVAAYLLNPNRRNYTLEAVALDVLGYQLGSGRAETPPPQPTDLFEQRDSSAPEAAEAAAVVSSSGARVEGSPR